MLHALPSQAIFGQQTPQAPPDLTCLLQLGVSVAAQRRSFPRSAILPPALQGMVSGFTSLWFACHRFGYKTSQHGPKDQST